MAMSLAQEEEVISDPENEKETDIEEENIHQTAIALLIEPEKLYFSFFWLNIWFKSNSKKVKHC